jgi:hypothetical protein
MVRQGLTAAGALALVAVPTAYGIWPWFADEDSWKKAAIGLAWLVLAALLTFTAVRRDEGIDRAIRERSATVRAAHAVALDKTVHALCSTLEGLPGFEATVYLPEGDRLVPIWPIVPTTIGADPRVFDVGKGATGTAWRDKATTLVVGDAVANDDFQLNPGQRTYFAKYRTVVSAVMRSESDMPVGVITLLSEQEGHFVPNSAEHDSLRVLAQTLGLLVVAFRENE